MFVFTPHSPPRYFSPNSTISLKMGRRSRRVQKLFSESDSAESVDFEISLAALLATLSLTYPHPVHPTVSQTVAFSALALTLLRRMAVLSEFVENEEETRRDWLMAWSIPFVEFVSVSAIILLIVQIYSSFRLEGLSAVLFWIGVVMVVILFAGVQELLFRDELLWWYQKFIERAERNPESEFWAYLSAIAWTLSRAPEADNASGRFRYGPSTGVDDYSVSDVARHFSKSLLIILVAGGVLFGLGYLVLGWAGVAVVYALIIVRDQVRFWYAAYGNGTFDQMAGPWYRTYIMIIIYLIAVRLII